MTWNLLFDELKLEKARIKNDELWCLCPNPEHKDTRPTNFSFNLKTGKGYCFACSYKTDIFEYGINNGIPLSVIRRLKRNIPLENEEYISEDFYLSSFLVDYYRKIPRSEYLLNRVERSVEILDLYEVYSDEEGNPVFFIKDKRGNYLSYWTRKNGRYYLISPTISKKRGDIFGLHLQPQKGYILTEGFFDAMNVTLKTNYEYLGISIQGTIPSEMQIKNLKKHRPLYIMMDGDMAGREARKRLHKIFSGLSDVYYLGGYSKDPDELSSSEIKKILERKKDFFEYEQNLSNQR